MIFELNSDYTLMLPKFTSFKDLYLFIHEFEEVCSFIHIPRVPNDAVRMKFTPFALKDDAKRWVYSLKVGYAK